MFTLWRHVSIFALCYFLSPLLVCTTKYNAIVGNKVSFALAFCLHYGDTSQNLHSVFLPLVACNYCDERFHREDSVVLLLVRTTKYNAIVGNTKWVRNKVSSAWAFCQHVTRLKIWTAFLSLFTYLASRGLLPRLGPSLLINITNSHKHNQLAST